MEQGMALLLRELPGDDTVKVFARLATLPGAHALLNQVAAWSDPLVDAVASHGTPWQLEQAAANSRLTPSQLARLIEAGGARVVTAAFPPDQDPDTPPTDPADPTDPTPHQDP
ncbi:hypothetical protein, partial [Streptomyces sp. SID3343]|uniref:hypothetical protein n=1 Tax=Streptomyces sp. SID3343 TaxID=2690260 RepID=UPI0013C0F956